MAWTYTNDPANVDRDAVRLLIGDVNSDDPQLTDEEIAFFLTDSGNVSGAALQSAKAILAWYARMVDKAVGDLRISYSQRREQYKTLVAQLEQRHAMRSATPFAGGISRSQKDTVTDDSDRVPPRFHRDQFRLPGSLDDTEKEWDD